MEIEEKLRIVARLWIDTFIASLPLNGPDTAIGIADRAVAAFKKTNPAFE